MFHLVEHGLAPAKFKRLKDTKFICPSCLFGKAHKRKWRNSAAHGSLRSDDDVPGSRTSIDHVISAQPGLVPRIDGRHSKERVVAGCVFVDHASRLSYTHLQTSVDNAQTIEAKEGYERFALSHGVTLKSFHSDNGVFAEKAFRDVLDEANQSITFCGVGAHHHNGIAEWEIRTMTEGTRANLLHAQRRWPNAIGTILWPFAWKDFENKKNHLRLDSDGRSAMNRFSQVDVKPDLCIFHPFGCPVFVLDSRLQSGLAKPPKWEPRAQVGVYLGHSPCHAGSVALVLNPKTLRVSPQFHLVYDDEFSTVPFMTEGTIPPHWEQLVEKSCELATDEDFDLATSWANDYTDGRVTTVAKEDASAVKGSMANLLNVVPPADNDEEIPLVSEEVPMVPEEAAADNSDPLLFPSMPDLNDLTCRRSSRLRNPSRAAKESTDPKY